jgi:hypothetical protein
LVVFDSTGYHALEELDFTLQKRKWRLQRMGPESIVVDSGWLAKVLFLSAFPAFVVGHFVVHGFSRFGGANSQ